MAITYSIAAMKDMKSPLGPKKYYAKAQASGVVDINEMAEEIGYATTLTDGDVLNVIRALINQINKHLRKGAIVKLENLGSFQAQLRSEGAVTEEAFTEANIRGIHIQFRPGLGVREKMGLGTLKFKKVPSLKALKPVEEEEEEIP